MRKLWDSLLNLYVGVVAGYVAGVAYIHARKRILFERGRRAYYHDIAPARWGNTCSVCGGKATHVLYSEAMAAWLCRDRNLCADTLETQLALAAMGDETDGQADEK